MILAFDLETTGVYDFKLPADDPAQPRVVEIAAVLCDDAGSEVDSYGSIIKPDGWTIPEYVAKIHGITTAIAMEQGRPIAEALDAFDALLARAGLLIAYNLKFDDKGLRSERRRLGRPDGFGTVPVFCCMKGATPLCKLERTVKQKKAGFDKGQYKTPKLSEAVQILLGREHVGAHGALADAAATKDIYFACRDNHEFMAAGSAFKTNEAMAAPPQATVPAPTAPQVQPPALAVPPVAVAPVPPKTDAGTIGDLFNLYNGDKAE